jgi:transposase
MWKPEHRRAADRHGLRYPSDLSDSEWALIEPAIPPAKHGGRRREVNVREVLNAIFYVLSTGCQWQALPKDLPPKSTAHSYFMLWDWNGTLERIHPRSMSRPASAKDARLARRLRSSIARAPRVLKKGLRARPARV